MQKPDEQKQTEEKGSARLWLVMAIAAFALHLPFLTQYGIFRDELYYLDCANHLAWGYVDHPPFSIAVLALSRKLLGDSVFAIRLPSLLAACATVYLVGYLTDKLGGKRFAQTLAMLAWIVAPVNLALSHFFSMNAFDLFFWALLCCLLLHLTPQPPLPTTRSSLGEGEKPAIKLSLSSKRSEVEQGILFGIVLGLALLNKFSVLWLIAGLTVGVLVTSYRRVLLKPGIWVAVGIALVVFAPHAIWQVQNGLPIREFVANASRYKMESNPPVQFLLTQVLQMNPLILPIWLMGIMWGMRNKAGASGRLFAVMFLTVLFILLVNGKSRSAYLVPAYAPILALGGIFWERTISGFNMRRLVLSGLSLGGAALMPMALPILPVGAFIAYSRAIGIAPPQEEKGGKGLLPQFYADMHGWHELANAVYDIYRTLPLPEQDDFAVFTNNYGEAGAVNYFLQGKGVPRAFSGHNAYWMWGTGDWNGKFLVIVNTVPKSFEPLFEDIEKVRSVPLPLSVPDEQDAPLYIARRLKIPVAEFWKQVKSYR